MSTTIGSALDGIDTILQGIDGTGSYTNDLSGDGRIVWGAGADLPDPPFLNLQDVLLETFTEGVPLGMYGRRIRIPIYGEVGIVTDSVTRKDVVKLAAGLLNDLCIAVEAGQRNFGGVDGVYNVRVEGDSGLALIGDLHAGIIGADLFFEFRGVTGV